jgi:hypothetical protein
MSDFTGVTLLFALRCLVPLVITLLIGYAASRLYARWEAEAGVKPRLQPRPVLRTAEGPDCWTVRGCSETSRAKCPAYQRPELTCWSARMVVEGTLRTSCATCDLFAPGLATGLASQVVPQAIRKA